jgi:excisionase family DNA binding protein
VSAKVLQTMVDRGQLPAVPVGTRQRIPARAVEEYVTSVAALTDRAVALVRAGQPPPPPPTSKEYRP